MVKFLRAPECKSNRQICHTLFFFFYYIVAADEAESVQNAPLSLNKVFLNLIFFK